MHWQAEVYFRARSNRTNWHSDMWPFRSKNFARAREKWTSYTKPNCNQTPLCVNYWWQLNSLSKRSARYFSCKLSKHYPSVNYYRVKSNPGQWSLRSKVISGYTQTHAHNRLTALPGSNLRPLRLFQEKRRRKKERKIETTGQKYNGLPFSIGRP